MKSGCPAHVGIIMDGNGRWAKRRGLPRSAGHRKGAEAMENLITFAEKETDIKYLTFYAFSTENWSRPDDEVKSLMQLFESYMDKLITDVSKHDIIIRFIGDRSRLSDGLRTKMEKCEAKSKKNGRLTVFIAVNYGGRQEIARAARMIAEDAASGRISPDSVDEDAVSRRLFTAEAPSADLIIRPSGEQRLSNFLIWQSAYAEFYYDSVLWPDFTGRDLLRAIDDYSERDRRFGGI